MVIVFGGNYYGLTERGQNYLEVLRADLPPLSSYTVDPKAFDNHPANKYLNSTEGSVLFWAELEHEVSPAKYKWSYPKEGYRKVINKLLRKGYITSGSKEEILGKAVSIQSVKDLGRRKLVEARRQKIDLGSVGLVVPTDELFLSFGLSVDTGEDNGSTEATEILGLDSLIMESGGLDYNHIPEGGIQVKSPKGHVIKMSKARVSDILKDQIAKGYLQSTREETSSQN